MVSAVNVWSGDIYAIICDDGVNVRSEMMGSYRTHHEFFDLVAMCELDFQFTCIAIDGVVMGINFLMAVGSADGIRSRLYYEMSKEMGM